MRERNIRCREFPPARPNSREWHQFPIGHGPAQSLSKKGAFDEFLSTTTFMLKASFRLGAKEVATLSRVGKRVSAPHLSLVYSVGTPKTAFAVSVGKGGVVNAVKRNRLRRRLYTAVRVHVLPKLKESALVMIRVQKSASSLTIEELNTELVSLCRRAGLI